MTLGDLQKQQQSRQWIDQEDGEETRELPYKYIRSQRQFTRDAPPHYKEFAKWWPNPELADDIIKDLRDYGWCQDTPWPKPAKQTKRSASRGRSASVTRGTTSASIDIVVAGLPEELSLQYITDKHGAPEELGSEIKCEPIYVEKSPHAHDFTPSEIAACAFHRMRGKHDIRDMPDIIYFHGTRNEYDKLSDPNYTSASAKDQLASRKEKLSEIYDKLAWESGLMVKRPDYEECITCYNKYKQEWEIAKERLSAISRDKNGIPEDLEELGKANQEVADLEDVLSYFTWNGTAQPGYIYATATPRNAGRLMIRCSDPRGECFGQIPVEKAHYKVKCACGSALRSRHAV